MTGTQKLAPSVASFSSLYSPHLFTPAKRTYLKLDYKALAEVIESTGVFDLHVIGRLAVDIYTYL